jgi:hypothetical protein
MTASGLPALSERYEINLVLKVLNWISHVGFQVHIAVVTNQVMEVFYPSTQRHYRRLIYYLYILLLHVSVVRPSSGRKYINS